MAMAFAVFGDLFGTNDEEKKKKKKSGGGGNGDEEDYIDNDEEREEELELRLLEEAAGGDEDELRLEEGTEMMKRKTAVRSLPLPRQTMRKVSMRLLPAVFLARYVYSLDKVNIAFAVPGMQASLELDERQFGIAMSAFYAASLVMQLPMSLCARRLGRAGVPLTLVLVGVTSAATAAARDIGSLCAARAALGIAESAVLPLLLSQLAVFYGRSELAWAWARTGVLSGFVTGITQGPISALILKVATPRQHHDAISGDDHPEAAAKGFDAWQWLFLIEAIPTLLTAALFFVVVPPNPHECARFLTRDEQAWLIEKTDANAAARERRNANRRQQRDYIHGETTSRSTFAHVGRLLRDTRVGILFVTSLCAGFGSSAIGLWMPSVLSGGGRNGPATVALLRAIPSASATVCLLLWARRSDARGERVGHASFGLVVMGLGLFLTALGILLESSAWTTALQLFTLSIADAGIGMYSSPFDALQGESFPESIATAAIALIAIAPNVGGLFGPFIVGWLKTRYESFVAPMLTLAFVAFLGAAVLMLFNRTQR